MVTHPLWRPYEPADLEAIDDAYVSGSVPVERVEVVSPDPAWPETARGWIERVEPVVDRVVEHVGSTSVPGLWAKPLIDLVVTLGDPDDESAYVPALEALGFVLRVREPEWDGHRVLGVRDELPGVNLHVFGPTAEEPARMIAFRDWLVDHDDDREAYATLKRRLAEGTWDHVMAYNNAKAPLIYDLYEKIFAADAEHPHDPHPRA